MKTYLFLLLLLSGCAIRPLKPGTSHIASSATNFISAMKQSENPALPSAQKFVETTETVSLFPDAPQGQPQVVRSKVERRADTTVGAAQKDTARELAAKLKSLSFLVYLGPLLALFGLATLVYPPLRLLIGSVTTSVLIMVAGLALTVLPVLVVGHELLILGAALGIILLWFFAHRHGSAQAMARLYQRISPLPPPPSS